jgi:Short repeat of unknown function (DUF308)
MGERPRTLAWWPTPASRSGTSRSRPGFEHLPVGYWVKQTAGARSSLLSRTVASEAIASGATREEEAYLAHARSPSMLAALSENWWALALRGLLAMLFGLAALFLPLDTLEAVGRLFGVYAITEGVLVVLTAIRGPDTGERLSPKGRPASWPDCWPWLGPPSPRSCCCTSLPSGRS